MILTAHDKLARHVLVWKDGHILSGCQEINTDTNHYKRHVYSRFSSSPPTVEEGTYDYLSTSDVMTKEEAEELRSAGVVLRPLEEVE